MCQSQGVGSYEQAGGHLRIESHGIAERPWRPFSPTPKCDRRCSHNLQTLLTVF